MLSLSKLRKLKDRIDGLWVKYYPITIQQGVFDEETDETLDVTLTNIKNDITNKANHGYGEEEPKTLKEVGDEKADHGYASIEVAKTLKQVEDDTINTIEKPTAQSLSELNARITALEAILSNKIKDRVDVTKEFNVWGKTNLILYGDGASTKVPDFIGQTYIDTTNSNVYIAVGNSNAGNWKLV